MGSNPGFAFYNMGAIGKIVVYTSVSHPGNPNDDNCTYFTEMGKHKLNNKILLLFLLLVLISWDTGYEWPKLLSSPQRTAFTKFPTFFLFGGRDS